MTDNTPMFKSHVTIEYLSYILLTLFLTTLLTVGQKNFYFIIPSLFLLSGLVLVIKHCLLDHFLDITQNHRIILYTFTAYSVVMTMIALIHQENIGTIKFELIPLALLPAWLFFCYFFNHPRVLYVIFPVASTVIGLFAIYDKYIAGAERAFEAYQPVIPTAGIAMTLALFCLTFFFAEYKNHLSYSLLTFFASLLGLIGSVLTGSRGAWLCFPVVFILLLSHFRNLIPRHTKLFFIPFIFVLLFLFLLLSNSGIALRFEQVKTDLLWYFRDHNANSSIGLRFEFWKSAIDGFLQKPLLGWGDSQYIAMKELQVQRGLIIPEAVPFPHAHNQFLDTLVKRGLAALLVTLSILWIPLRLFYRYRHHNKVVAILGYILVFDVFTFSLSDSFLRLPLGMIFYMMTVYVLLGFLIKYEPR